MAGETSGQVPLVDIDRLTELRDEIGPEDLEVVVSAFLEEADEAIALLSRVGETDGLAAQLHFLRGAALNLGLAALAECCRLGEASAQAGRPGDMDLAALLALYDRSREHFLAAMDSIIDS